MSKSTRESAISFDLETNTTAIDLARESGITVFGAGNFAQSLARALQSAGIRIAAMVVTAPQANSCNGIPLLALASLDERLRQLPMWIGVFNREATSDYAALAAMCSTAGVHTLLAPPQYFDSVANAMGWRYWLTERSNYDLHQDALDETVDTMADSRSRQQLSATIAFRLGGPPSAVPQPDSEYQYFPDFMTSGMTNLRTYVDGGAYDGDTIREAARYLKPERAVAFEPDPDNFARLAAAVASLAFPVTCFPSGLSDATQYLRASIGRGDATAIGYGGQDLMQVVRLDECLPNVPIDYLKLDVEGHELAVLAGAEKCLRRYRPRLALAGYHRWDDLWRIPRFIQRLELDYRIAYRIHAHNTFESVFYAY